MFAMGSPADAAGEQCRGGVGTFARAPSPLRSRIIRSEQVIISALYRGWQRGPGRCARSESRTGSDACMTKPSTRANSGVREAPRHEIANDNVQGPIDQAFSRAGRSHAQETKRDGPMVRNLVCGSAVGVR